MRFTAARFDPVFVKDADEIFENQTNTYSEQEDNSMPVPLQGMDEKADGQQPPDSAALEEAKRQVEAADARWKKAAADLENHRRRFNGELERFRDSERETVLREWLNVVDNIERGLSAAQDEENPWHKGMQAIYEQMLGVLKKFGVQPDNPIGQEFDPERHEAVGTVKGEYVPKGRIFQVVRTGYTMNDRILQTAQVITVE